MADLMHRVEGVIILDSEGKRIFCKYYGEAFEGKQDKQAKFEEKLYEKTHVKTGPESPKEGGDITLIDSHTVVFRLDPEVYFYVIGSLNENEVIISDALCTVYEAISTLLRSPCAVVEKRQLLENFDLLVLVIDETFHDGLLLQNSAADVLDLVYEHADSQDPMAKIKQALKNQASHAKY